METPHHDDAASRALLERARSGDREAFGTLFQAHREDIARLCLRLLDDPAAAEDATSEVFLRARRSFRGYDVRKPFWPWLAAVASNYCIDQLRRRKTEKRLFSAADLSEQALADDSPDVLRRLTHLEERGAMLRALDGLPAKYRLPLVLRFYRDLDYDSIADILGITRNQVGTLLFRAKKRLRERLAAGDDEVAVGRDSQPGIGASEAIRDSRRRRRRRASSKGSRDG